MSIMTSVRRSLPVAALAAAFAFTPVALAQDATPGVTPTPYEAPADLAELSGEINADGSSTVGPLTTVASENFFEVAPNVNISVNVSGTGGGFESFCNGDTDIQNASRGIADDEVALCAENGVDYYQFTVAYDGVVVVVPTSNTFLTSLTTEQLRQIWMGEITNYNELDPSYPDLEISLFGPDDQSGTFDFFNEEILGEDEAGEVITPAADYEPSSDDNTLVEGVAGTEGGLGYFGFAYYEENQDRLNVVSLSEEGGEPVAPSLETISDGSYAPLSRSLYVFVSAASLSENVALQEFLRYYIASAGELALSIGSVAAPGEAYVEDQEKLEGAISGEIAPDSQAAA
ncbi:MAG TPA: PstS family phosphate ABC transporter substrate-binding protein [Thermomicrobiales bacterium]|jgi:phosphate transport system substrate-binding protein|nr:PstS family phosphate ABC transporter substrate-binding protein [Thermomicrobiales bacterium]